MPGRIPRTGRDAPGAGRRRVHFQVVTMPVQVLGKLDAAEPLHHPCGLGLDGGLKRRQLPPPPHRARAHAGTPGGHDLRVTVRQGQRRDPLRQSHGLLPKFMFSGHQRTCYQPFLGRLGAPGERPRGVAPSRSPAGSVHAGHRPQVGGSPERAATGALHQQNAVAGRSAPISVINGDERCKGCVRMMR